MLFELGDAAFEFDLGKKEERSVTVLRIGAQLILI